MNNYFKYLLFFLVLFITTQHSAREILIYADSINYDSESNMIGKGNVKIISENRIISSNLVIINEITKKITLPIDFTFKDEKNNYYYGTSGEFSSNFENGIINDIKLLLNDGSRIVGKKAIKTGKIDLIDKGVYSACESKIKINNFICPIWQIEAEKILHDREQLFLHQKHSKMRIFNLPVYYLPYLVTPSPLRKKRKSGFLTPTISFNFLDTKTSQATSFPYYFALSEDKELLLTPTINYGGGVNASQRIVNEYYQVISGGNISVKVSADTNLENDNNESWLRDASVITNYDKNINEKFKMNFESAFQTSPTYLRRSDQNNFLNRKNTLSTTLNVHGYNLKKIDDHLTFNIAGYQVVKDNEDNKTTPTTLPYIEYSTGQSIYNGIKFDQTFSFYNIFRDISTTDHAQKQQKINYKLSSDKVFYKYKSKINFKTQLLSQLYQIENKKIDSLNYSGNYNRLFPMAGIFFETPIVNRINNLSIIPKISLIINGSQSSSNKISNEESTNNTFSIINLNYLNRYTGTDKLDNSKRINYGFDVNKGSLNLSFYQSYEFATNSNFSKDVGFNDHMTDLLGNINYTTDNNTFNHNLRFNVDQGLIASQGISFLNKNTLLGETEIKYSQERVENNSILENGSETLDLNFTSNKFLKYSTIGFLSKYDLIKDDPISYSLNYSYFDECFGINLDFKRSFFSDRDLKPQDILTIMFSFKHLGSYKSTNLAVDHMQRQQIQWESGGVDNEKFD